MAFAQIWPILNYTRAVRILCGHNKGTIMKKLLLLLAVTSTCLALPAPELLQEKDITNKNHNVIDEIISMVSTKYDYPHTTPRPLNEIKQMLQAEGPALNTTVINKALTTLKCADEYSVDHNNVLTIIDYSLPSSEKRLWVFDLKDKKLLFHTYVSHGIRSGVLSSNYFSNLYNSKASSIGIYKTEKAYYGRHGVSLRLDGLERGFNDNASGRSVVMHGGWYVDEPFIKKYGRAGRSWGCPAVPENLTEPIINTIKENSLFVVYYPSDNWLVKSKFLHCELSPIQKIGQLQPEVKPPTDESEHRDAILFADVNRNNQHEESEPILVVTADNYQQLFHAKAPLERMLRRQINQTEYIALTNTEFNSMVTNNDIALNKEDKGGLNTVHFVIPVVKMQRGYYATEMNFVNWGKIKDAQPTTDSSSTAEQTKNYSVHLEEKPVVSLKTTNQFIRWLGL